MTKIFSVFVLLTIGCLLSTTPARARAASPSATPSESTPSAVQELREKVKEIVRQKIDEVKKGQKRAYFGEITKIDGNMITIFTPTNRKRQVKVSEETKIVKADGLKVGDFIIAMGYLTDDEVLEAKRIVVAAKPKVLSRQVAVGKVTDISAEEKILTVRNEKKDLTYTVLVVGNTTITKKVGTKIQKVNFDKIEKDDRLVAIGTLKENGEKILTAKLIHIIPGLNPSPTP